MVPYRWVVPGAGLEPARSQ